MRKKPRYLRTSLIVPPNEHTKDRTAGWSEAEYLASSAFSPAVDGALGWCSGLFLQRVMILPNEQGV